MSFVRPFSVMQTCFSSRSMWKMACSRIGVFSAASLPRTGTRRGPSTGSSNLISFTLERSAVKRLARQALGSTHELRINWIKATLNTWHFHSCSKEIHSLGNNVHVEIHSCYKAVTRWLHSKLPAETGITHTEIPAPDTTLSTRFALSGFGTARSNWRVATSFSEEWISEPGRKGKVRVVLNTVPY